MKSILLFGVLFAFITSGCKPKEIASDADKAKILTTGFWKLDRFSDANYRTLTGNALASISIGFFDLEFEFLEGNKVRARDKTTKQIKNAGTWYLLENNTVLDINVIGFAGKFKVLELSKTKLIIQAPAKNDFYSDIVNLDLYPAL